MIVEQTPVWCHHCPGWCFAKHPGRSPAKKDNESQAIKKWIVQCLHKQRPFSGPPIFFQKESKLLFYQLIKVYSYEPLLLGSFFAASCISSFIQCNACLPIIN
jgi:hypothetical protein